MISLDHVTLDQGELERFGSLDLDSFESMQTVAVIMNHPWDLHISIIARQPSWMPPPNCHWQDYVLAHADRLAALMTRDHLDHASLNVPVTAGPGGKMTYTFELKFVARPVRDVKVVVEPVVQVHDDVDDVEPPRLRPYPQELSSPLFSQAARNQRGSNGRKPRR